MLYGTFDEELVDICSSGQGGDLEKWHRKEIKKLIKKTKWTAAQKLQYFTTIFLPNVLNSDGWAVSDIRLIKELLEIEGELVFSIKP